MTDFRIEITPPLPQAERILTNPPDLSGDYHLITTAIFAQYQIVYHFNGEKFAYYPADIYNTYLDLCWEIEKFKSGESHYMSLVGYDVAYARLKGGSVWLYDVGPRNFGKEDQFSLKGDGAPLNTVILDFERAASAVFEEIKKGVKLDV